MRILFSISLAILTLLSWMEGLHHCHRHIQMVENQMEAQSYVEQMLADRYSSVLQQGSTVKVVDSTYTGRQGYIYPGDFVYHAEIEGDTAHFIIESSEESTTTYTVAHLPASHKEYPPHTALEDFFSWYMAVVEIPLLSKHHCEFLFANYPPYQFILTLPAGERPVQPPETAPYLYA